MTSASYIGRALTAILLVGTLGVLAGCSSEAEDIAVVGSAKAAKLTHCVEPTSFMRRNHMELIKHQRDVTVHQGVRDTRYSLAGCIDCHVQYDIQGKAVPVNAEDQFCDRCHDWLAVRPDCFQCHSPVPRGPQSKDMARMGESRLSDPQQLMAAAAGTDEGLAETSRVAQEKGN
jgi:hypothetical protein